MYSFLSSVDSFSIKNQVREQIFSLLGNSGKTIFPEYPHTEIYAHLSIPWYNQVRIFIQDVWNTPRKKLTGYALLALTALMFGPAPTSFAATSTTETFIVTAYYSPLPNQSFYLKGDYEAEKQLDGNGNVGADGTPVFTGMIAAPKTYAFGTHIFFPGIGVGTVHDRGGAIVDAWDRGQPYDRIDIWMGYGDIGLHRAMLWGRREVTATIVTDTTGMSPINLEGITNGQVQLSNYPSVKSPAAGGISQDVISAFSDLGYTVVGGDVSAMITQFQLDHHVITSKSDTGAGNYGPKTRAALSLAHDEYDKLHTADLQAVAKAQKELMDAKNEWDQQYNKTQSYIQSIGSPHKGEKGTNIVALQTTLKDIGFYRGMKTGIMNTGTITALRRYQVSRGLKTTGTIDKDTEISLINDIVEA